MLVAYGYRLLIVAVLPLMLWGCGTARYAQAPDQEFGRYAYEAPRDNDGYDSMVDLDKQYEARRYRPDMRVFRRVMSEDELWRLSNRDPDLTPTVAKQILARLNKRATYYIGDDIRNGVPLNVPADFSAYKHWTPLPKKIPALAELPKLILVVKDIPFLGWYEGGRLVEDSFTCIGKDAGWTDAGLYRVLEKDADHISRSYTNAYGEPAPMPLALRIYGTVWIHAGDIERGYCSHGCINLPVTTAKKLFDWADTRTAVLVVESVSDLQEAIRKNSSSCVLFIEQCSGRQKREM
ncbi:MAG: L,D-transpeptidase [Acidobacteriota bacterium]